MKKNHFIQDEVIDNLEKSLIDNKNQLYHNFNKNIPKILIVSIYLIALPLVYTIPFFENLIVNFPVPEVLITAMAVLPVSLFMGVTEIRKNGLFNFKKLVKSDIDNKITDYVLKKHLEVVKKCQYANSVNKLVHFNNDNNNEFDAEKCELEIEMLENMQNRIINSFNKMNTVRILKDELNYVEKQNTFTYKFLESVPLGIAFAFFPFLHTMVITQPYGAIEQVNFLPIILSGLTATGISYFAFDKYYKDKINYIKESLNKLRKYDGNHLDYFIDLTEKNIVATNQRFEKEINLYNSNLENNNNNNMNNNKMNNTNDSYDKLNINNDIDFDLNNDVLEQYNDININDYSDDLVLKRSRK